MPCELFTVLTTLHSQLYKYGGQLKGARGVQAVAPLELTIGNVLILHQIKNYISAHSVTHVLVRAFEESSGSVVGLQLGHPSQRCDELFNITSFTESIIWALCYQTLVRRLPLWLS